GRRGVGRAQATRAAACAPRAASTTAAGTVTRSSLERLCTAGAVRRVPRHRVRPGAACRHVGHLGRGRTVVLPRRPPPSPPFTARRGRPAPRPTDARLTIAVDRIDGAVTRADADAMADAIWKLLGKRGVARDDTSTWPRGFVSKLQPLRQRRVFDAFATDAV